MDTKDEIKNEIWRAKHFCQSAVNDSVQALSNPLNTRTDLIATANNINKSICDTFKRLTEFVDQLPICGPVQIIPEGYVPFFPPKPEPESEPTLETIPTVSQHIDHLVDIWIANPMMTTGQVCDLYDDLLDGAFDLAATRKDGEESCQC